FFGSTSFLWGVSHMVATVAEAGHREQTRQCMHRRPVSANPPSKSFPFQVAIGGNVATGCHSAMGIEVGDGLNFEDSSKRMHIGFEAIGRTFAFLAARGRFFAGQTACRPAPWPGFRPDSADLAPSWLNFAREGLRKLNSCRAPAVSVGAFLVMHPLGAGAGLGTGRRRGAAGRRRL